jgi:outer membrane lipoprotein SlyB
LPSGTSARIGEIFTIFNSSGKQVAQVKVVENDADLIIARESRTFVSEDILRNAIGAGLGAAIGTLALEPITGAIVGAALGNALSRRQRLPITAGMRVVSALEIE